MGDAIREKNVEPPIRRGRVTQFGIHISPTKELRRMKPGESLIVDTKEARNVMASIARQLGIKFQTAKEDGKFRIWRMA